MARARNKATPRQQFWREHRDRWAVSGQSKADYCREHQLSATAFYQWCRLLRDTEPRSKTLNFVPVELRDRAPESQLVADDRARVRFGRLIVDLPVTIAEPALRQWLSALRGDDDQR